MASESEGALTTPRIRSAAKRSDGEVVPWPHAEHRSLVAFSFTAAALCDLRLCLLGAISVSEIMNSHAYLLAALRINAQ